jgi:hypothetical protein
MAQELDITIRVKSEATRQELARIDAAARKKPSRVLGAIKRSLAWATNRQQTTKINCPWHQERTPSCHINWTKGFYHCFGCGKAGDIPELREKLKADRYQPNFTTASAVRWERFGHYERAARPAPVTPSL